MKVHEIRIGGKTRFVSPKTINKLIELEIPYKTIRIKDL